MKYFSIINPYNQKIIKKIQDFSKGEIHKRLLFLSKNKINLNKKNKITIITKLIKHINNKKIKNSFKKLITDEVGVSYNDADFEFERFKNSSEITLKILRSENKNLTNKFKKFEISNLNYKVLRKPLKMGFAITPFNLPLILSAHKIFPAIISGTPLILKPSELTPLSSIKLVNLLIKCGLDKNFITIITTSKPKKIFNQIIKFSHLEFLSFTGSLKVGIEIKKNLPNKKFLKSIFELGGISPMIITSEFNLDRAVKFVIEGCFKYTGQRCTTARKIIIEKKIYNKFIPKLIKAVKNLTYGINKEDSYMGVMVHHKFVNDLKKRVNSAINDGAKLIYGKFSTKKNTNIISPIILTKVKKNMNLISEEILGPICPILIVRNFNEALKIANHGDYNIAGSILSQNMNKIKKATKFLNVNQLNINNVPGFRSEVTPFGGSNKSGNFYKEGLICASEEMSNTQIIYKHI